VTFWGKEQHKQISMLMVEHPSMACSHGAQKALPVEGY
jgi:hypothetical protein